MAKSNGGSFGLTLGYPGVDTIEGTLISYDKSGIYFSSKKSGSSTLLNQFYPESRVIACYGTKGGDATLVYMTDRVPVFRSGKRGKEKPLEVTGIEIEGNFAITKSDDFPVVIARAEYALFSGEEKDDSAPKRGRKAAAPSGKKKEKKSGKETKGKSAKAADWE